MSKLDNKTAGKLFVLLGGIFFLAGIVIFILYNKINLYAQKADASIMSRYAVESEEDPHTMLELAYRVGDEMVYATYSYYGELDEDTLNLTIYYNIKNPKEILDAGWHFEPAIPAFFGILIFMIGMYYMGIITFGIEPAKAPGDKASEWDKKYYAAREKAENSLIPLLGVMSFIIFGVFLVVNKTGWWAWIFVVFGTLSSVYLLTDLVPALKEFFALRRMKNFNGKTLVVDEDFEEFEKKQDENGKGKSKKSEKSSVSLTKDNNNEGREENITEKEYEVEDTFEIKSLETPKKKKKK